MTQTQPVTAEVPGDLRMAKRLWPFLLASTVSLIPFTVFGMYLVPIADAAGGSVAEIGGLRGLGGLAALAVGVLLAPLMDRAPRELVAAGDLKRSAARRRWCPRRPRRWRCWRPRCWPGPG